MASKRACRAECYVDVVFVGDCVRGVRRGEMVFLPGVSVYSPVQVAVIYCHFTLREAVMVISRNSNIKGW